MSSDATEAANWIVSHMGVALDIGSDLFLPELRESVIRGWFEAPEAEALRALVQPEDVFLEIGAGSGFISSFVWSLRRASRIIAVEANPSLIPMIKSTHALNGVHAEVVHELIGAEDCNATKLHIHSNFLASSTMMESKTSVEVCQSSLARRLAEWRPSIICIDVEGAELDLLSPGLPDFVERLVVEVHEPVYGLTGIDRAFRIFAKIGFVYVSGASHGPVIGLRRVSAAA